MDNLNQYFSGLKQGVLKCYEVAKNARKQGIDPVTDVEIPIAENMAERVEGLISAVAPQIKGSGVVARIQELEIEYGKLDWRVALQIALEVAQQKFCHFKDTKESLEVGIKTGFAYATSGVVSSPLEGFVELKFMKRKDNNKEYFCLYYSGPVRSAGGTGASVSVLIADYVRRNFGYSTYDPSEEEIKRSVIECIDYHEKVTNLQYFPSEEEIIFMCKNLPVQISGDPSEKYEVSNYKDLERVGTNRIRNGFCLVIAECLCQKAPKLQKQLSKWGNDFQMYDWKFINDFVELQKRIKSKTKQINDNVKVRKDYTFIKDIVAGRPVISQPSRSGGLRLRYGKTRLSGFASVSMHPATMFLLDNYIAVGTQLKYERPGKSTAIAPCNSINGPIIKLNNGDVVYVKDTDKAKLLRKECKEILYLGDIIVNYGEFLNRAHILVPVGYCEEWWIKELLKIGGSVDNISLISGVHKDILNKLIHEPIRTEIGILEAFKLSKSLKVPLHPSFIFYWSEITNLQLIKLVEWLEKASIKREDSKIILQVNNSEDLELKRILEIVGVPHRFIEDKYVIIENNWADALMINLGFFSKELFFNKDDIKDLDQKSLETVNMFSEAIIRDKSGTFIGARMGRPEKAKLRKLTGSPHVLFPVGQEGDRLRSLQEAINNKKVSAEFCIYYCNKCSKETIYPRCESCNSVTDKKFYCQKCDLTLDKNICKSHGECLSYKPMKIDISYYYNNAINKLKLKQTPTLIKGVRGTSNKDHIPENLVKGILRSIHDLYVNKDGTIRYDMTEMPMTHFKPKEVGTSINKLKELGYLEDIHGNPLLNDDQVLELKPQDIVLPSCAESGDEGADTVFFRVGNFVDDILEHLYGLPRFYNFKTKEDLIGQLVIGLAPHTSAGTLGRIIGFIKAQGVFANFMWHAAQRRDCDGDETCCILLLEGLLNFSRHYLPAHRGSTQDAPLVLTIKLIPSEIDEQALDVDVAWDYPLELYEAALEYKQPWEVKIERVADRLNTENQYSNFGYTHYVDDINDSVRVSAYKYLETMMDKVRGQMDLAERIRAVNVDDVAKLVIERHFIRDIKGNLRQFSTQQFRCVKCNEKYRRPPLIGVCVKCGNRLLFTVSEGTIVKYLEPSLELAAKYNLPNYLKQTLEITKMRIESIFGKDKEKQEGLVKWFNS